MEQQREQLQKKAVFIHSPHAGRAALLLQALTHLREAGIEIVTVSSIKDVDEVKKFLCGDDGRDIGMLIAAGGDGLVGGVTPLAVEHRLPLGILPLGTANDVARTVGIPLDLLQAVQVISNGGQREIDLGQAGPHGALLTPEQRAHLFVHALTVGINVEFAQLATSPSVREQYRAMAYPFAVFEALRSYKPIEVEVTFHGLLMSRPATRQASEPMILRCLAAQVTVVNAPVFWGALQATVPGVSLDDRLLDIIVIENGRVEDLVLSAIRFLSRPHEQLPIEGSWHARNQELFPAELTNIVGVHHFKARSLTIATKEPQNVTLDGEICGQTPIDVQVAANRLKLIVPNQPATNSNTI